MKELLKAIKRYKVFFTIEAFAIVAVAVYIIGKRYGFYWGFGPGSVFTRTDAFGYALWWVCRCIAESFLYATTPTVLAFTFVRYIIYDNKNQKILNASFPMTNRENYVTELFLGGIPIAVTSFIYVLLEYFYGSFWRNGGFIWDPQIFFDLLVWGLAIIALLLGTYAFLVFARKVSSSIGGMILLYVVSAFLAVFIFNFVIDPLLYADAINNTVFMLIYLLIFSIPVIVSIIGLVITGKKIDLAKGGTYYFKPVQMVVCAMSGLAYLVWMLGFYYDEKGALTPLYTTISVITSLLVTACVYFLTRARKNPGRAVAS